MNSNHTTACQSEEVHVRFPNMYIGLRLFAGKPLKLFYKEVYEEMRKEASKMLDDTKKQLESAIKIDEDNKSPKKSCLYLLLLFLKW